MAPGVIGDKTREFGITRIFGTLRTGIVKKRRRRPY
jgi:hypothetical protein